MGKVTNLGGGLSVSLNADNTAVIQGPHVTLTLDASQLEKLKEVLKGVTY